MAQLAPLRLAGHERTRGFAALKTVARRFAARPHDRPGGEGYTVAWIIEIL